ncbi:hypothetical protein PG993_012281 [Apiospora rasikravindrae]|uniref:Uncharacterized protein n=1 Tax=Apiospora rasikravindrae TaxID=990691 RepID=A0ABR1S3F1_9PEZI
MAGPRLTAPVARQIARSISTTTHTQAVPKSTTLITSSKTAAPLMRKYADLLKERNLELEGRSREFTTRSANRPHPPPKRMRLMQTLNPSASYSQAAVATQGTVDAFVLPNFNFAEAPAAESGPRMPLLPDSYSVAYAPEAADEPLPKPEISIVAAHPETVSPSALTEVEGMTMDGVELKFAHESSHYGPSSTQSSYSEQGDGMIKGIWNGLLDDVFGESSKTKSKLAV